MLHAPATAVAILAYPETTASVVYGMYDLFASAGRDWGLVVSGQPGPELMRPLVVAAKEGAFEAANGVTIAPQAGLRQTGPCEIVCVPELAVPPGDDLSDRFTQEIEWIRDRYRSGAIVASLRDSLPLTMRVANTYWGSCRSASASSKVVFTISPPRRW